MSGWPFRGDSNVVRARKMALAYRQLAAEQQQRATRLRAVLTGADLKALRSIDKNLATRIADLLKEKVGDPVHEMDERFLNWGEQWHTPMERTSYDEEEELRTEEAAKLIQIAAGTLLTLRKRGRIKGTYVKDQNPHFEFKVADLYKLQSELRGRNWRKGDPTDTVAGSESSAP